jgi:hypothetical protein
MAKEPTFHELFAVARAHQNRQPAPAIGDVDPDAVEVRNSRSRKTFRDMIASKEASPKGYDSYLNDYFPAHAARPQKPISQMTLDEVYAYQDRLAAEMRYNPVGRYQILKPTLQMMQRVLRIPSDRVFDAELQDQIADGLLTHRWFQKYVSGQISESEFHDNLAKEWDSIEFRDTGKSYKGNRSRTTGAQVLGAISQIGRD